MVSLNKITILGAGNIGTSLARGLSTTPKFNKEEIYLTRRSLDKLEEFKKEGFQVTADNCAAVRNSSIIILCVEPHQASGVLEQISKELDPDTHVLISVVSGLGIDQIKSHINKDINVIRAMPNIAIIIGESMTCLAAQDPANEYLKMAEDIFNTVGETLVIEEEQMAGATSLGACGVAFFLRAIRAASQGGIEVGFHAEEALRIATNTAKGAASLLAHSGSHPESEIDKVTTPMGCTISGLNQMEHDGFSSAMIKGIKISAEKAADLYTPEKKE